MKDAALKLALEALQWSKPHEGAVLTYGAAIAAIKAAMAQDEPWCMKMNGCKTKCEDCPVEVVEQDPISFGIRGGMAHDIGIKND